jgi:hypothetical protein
MKVKPSNAIASSLLCVLAAIFVTGCEKKNANGVAAPGIEETKTIAEEGFIYGLPIVMNYAVMNVMRLYWPTETAPSILPPGEGTWQPPPVAQAS